MKRLISSCLSVLMMLSTMALSSAVPVPPRLGAMPARFRRSGEAGQSGTHRLPVSSALDTAPAYEPLHGAARHGDALVSEFVPDLELTVDAAGGSMHAPDGRKQIRITPGPF